MIQLDQLFHGHIDFFFLERYRLSLFHWSIAENLYESSQNSKLKTGYFVVMVPNGAGNFHCRSMQCPLPNNSDTMKDNFINLAFQCIHARVHQRPRFIFQGINAIIHRSLAAANVPSTLEPMHWAYADQMVRDLTVDLLPMDAWPVSCLGLYSC